MSAPEIPLEQISSLEEYNDFVKTCTKGVVYFRADWAAPCRQMDAVVRALRRKHDGALSFRAVSVDACGWALSALDVTHVPTFVLCAHGRVVGRVEGARAAELTQRAGALEGLSAAAAVREAVRYLAGRAPVVVFMKGAPDAPRCGFSRQLVALLRQAGIVFAHVDVLQDEQVREQAKKAANWPTFPQLYAHGQLLGGLDAARVFADAGTLVKEIERRAAPLPDGDAPPAAQPPPPPNGDAAPPQPPSPTVQRPDAPLAEPDSATVEESGIPAALHARLKELVARDPVMLFMKGSPAAPRCGFSRKVVALLAEQSVEGYGHFDILGDDDVRQGLKKFAKWPTFPQIYAKGEFIGGLDIAKELAAAGALREELGVTPEEKVECLDDKLKRLIKKSPVMVFMKGVPDAPRCGFSRELVALLREQNVVFEHFDILEDNEVRQGLKKLSKWPTYPQIYASGELIGGLDIAKELAASSALRGELGLE